MDGLTAAGTLTSRGALSAPRRAARLSAQGRFVFEVASASDDTEVRRLLRDASLPGEIQLSLEREPDSAAAAAIEGDVHDTIVARDQATGAIAAIAARSVRRRYVNGTPVPVGYLSQLRVAPAYRRARGLLDGGFAFCRGLHSRGEPHFYLASVVADNHIARRLLERGLPNAPAFRAIDRLVTLAIPVRGVQLAGRTRGEIVSGSECGPLEILRCLDQHQSRYQFAPCWSERDFESPARMAGLRLEDFSVAVRGGRAIGCVACWDQRGFKQVVVRGYAPRLARLRWLINLSAGLRRDVPLPPIGCALDFGYLSHLGMADDDPATLEILIRAACAIARRKRLDYVVVGLSAAMPALTLLRRAFRHRAYESVIYAGVWDDGSAVRKIDGRPAHPEVAVL
jgi:hypothetical protein